MSDNMKIMNVQNDMEIDTPVIVAPKGTAKKIGLSKKHSAQLEGIVELSLDIENIVGAGLVTVLVPILIPAIPIIAKFSKESRLGIFRYIRNKIREHYGLEPTGEPIPPFTPEQREKLDEIVAKIVEIISKKTSSKKENNNYQQVPLLEEGRMKL